MKTFLRFTNWLRLFISRYAQRVSSFQKRKINLTRQLFATIKELTRKQQIMKIDFYEFTHNELKTFKNLKNAFRKSIFLTYYNRKRKLFIDLNTSKNWDFVDMIYHVKNDSSNNDFSRIKIQFIMFFSRCLNNVERNYWSTKLKIVEIIWIIRKIRHLIEFNEYSSIIIYIDHFVAIFISRQINLITFSIDKLNIRLVRISQYLSKFNLIIKHKFNKFNIIFDALSRFQNNTNISINDKIDVLETLYDIFIEFCFKNLVIVTSSLSKQSIYHITLIKIIDVFKQKLKRAYQKDTHWKKILDLIKSISQNNVENDMSILIFTSINDTIDIIDSIIVTLLINFTTSIDLSTKFESNTIIISNDETTINKFDLRFKYKQNLIYFIVDDERERFCVSTLLK